ncbi:hypothetical protein [Microcoleus sp. OTE_8_concoct_300]|uniref:hypothetical protein n=1 Tax=Microcoleus sp. OTE_8_concoct_300 TaxID=2964710 RepID=UPI00403F46CC
MTFLDDAPCLDGRSQLFTFKAKESITIDRPTLERILFLLNGCRNHFEYLCSNDIFVFATKKYLADLDNVESRKALNLLGVWTDTWPDGSEELANCLDEAVQSVEFILAASAGGGND